MASSGCARFVPARQTRPGRPLARQSPLADGSAACARPKFGQRWHRATGVADLNSQRMLLTTADGADARVEMNYHKRHIGDYLKDTAHLSLLEHVYARLLDVRTTICEIKYLTIRRRG